MAAPSAVAASGDAIDGPIIVGVGSAGVDYLASVAAFPKPDAKLRTDSFEVQGGGNCGNALTATARLGCRPRILTKLSDDGAGKAIFDEFEKDGVDASAIVVERGKSSPFTYIIVDRAGSTRTCIHTPGPEFHAEEMTEEAILELLTGASLAYFDGRLTEIAIRVASRAREANIPVLVEGERLRESLDELLRLGDYVCTSAGYPRDATGEKETETAMIKLLSELPRAKSLVTTLGSSGALMVSRVKDSDRNACEKKTLKEVLAALKDESMKTNEDDSESRTEVPLPGLPVSSATLYLTDAGDDAMTAVGPVCVTFAPACAMTTDQIVDTTGAGDLYAAGFLARWAAGADLAECGRVASVAAAEAISHLGARPQADLRSLVVATE
jgi:sugar/nucleoside kinase (ribokinase family)